VIDIAARNLVIDGARISTHSDSGSGGQVLLSVDGQLLLVQGEITTQVFGNTTDANAGDINIGLRATPISLTNPCEGHCGAFDPFAFVAGPNPDDGIPDTFVNEGGSIIGSAQLGRGGAVTIVADSIVNNGVIQSDPDSGIDVSSAQGVDGTTSVVGTPFALPNFVIAPDDDFRSMCDAQRRGAESSFVEALGGRAYDPTGLRFAPYGEAPGPLAEATTLSLCASADHARERRRRAPVARP
jgi:hypothetical protein